MATTKTCSKCGLEKELTEFHVRNKKTGLHRNDCKLCNNAASRRSYRENRNDRLTYRKAYVSNNKDKVTEARKAYYETHKEELLCRNKEYRQANKEQIAIKDKRRYDANKDKVAIRRKAYYNMNQARILAQKKVYRTENKEKVAQSAKKYRETNKYWLNRYLQNYRVTHKERLALLNNSWRKANAEYLIAKARAYRQMNKDSINERARQYTKARRHQDKVYDLQCKLRNRLYYWFKDHHKKSSTTRLLVGLDYKEVMEYLNNNERGLKVGDPGVHIDHIIPLKAFTDNGMMDSEFGQRCACNWRNLQLLPASENMSKNCSYEQAEFERYVEMFKSL